MSDFAEDLNYWDTTVHPAKSLGEIQELLSDFGAEAMMVTQGQSAGRLAWLIRFQWRGRAYHFVFTPLECRTPARVSSFGGKRRPHEEQARYQMGRIAMNFVKAILTAAGANADALFGFLELPGVFNNPAGQIPPTVAELDVQGLVAAIPDLRLSIPTERRLLGNGQ